MQDNDQDFAVLKAHLDNKLATLNSEIRRYEHYVKRSKKVHGDCPDRLLRKREMELRRIEREREAVLRCRDGLYKK